MRSQRAGIRALEQTLAGHTGLVRSVAVSADGGRAVSGGDDGTVRVWDLAAGRQQAQLTGHHGAVRSVAVSADGGRAVSGGDDGTVRVWDLAAGRQQAQLTGHHGAVRSVAVSADGGRAVSGGDDGTVRVWDLAAGRQQAQLTGHHGAVRSVAVSADGARAVSGGDDGTVRVWDLAAGRQQAQLTGHHGAVRSVAVSADGARAVSGGDDSTVRRWELVMGGGPGTITGYVGPVHAVAVTADGAAATIGDNGSVHAYDLDTGVPGRRTRDDGPVYAVAVSAFGTRAVSAGSDGLVRVWDMARLLKDKAYWVGTGTGHLINLPAYIFVLAWPLVLIGHHYTTTRTVDCSKLGYTEAFKTPGCHSSTIKIPQYSLGTVSPTYSPPKAGQIPTFAPVNVGQIQVKTGRLVGTGTVTVPHSVVSATAIVVEAMWIVLVLALIIAVRQSRIRTRNLPPAERVKSASTKATFAQTQQSQAEGNAISKIIVTFVTAIVVLVVGLVAGHVFYAVPLLFFALGGVLILAGNWLTGSGDRLLKITHLALGAAAIGWALVDIIVFHSPRYALSAAVFGAWILFYWKAMTYGHRREWTVCYLRLSAWGALVSCLSGGLAWQLQAAFIAATIALSVAAAISISVDQRRWRSHAVPRVHEGLRAVISFTFLTLLGSALLALTFISGEYSLLWGAVPLLLFGLAPVLAAIWLAGVGQRAKRRTRHSASTEHDHHGGPPASSSRA